MQRIGVGTFVHNCHGEHNNNTLGCLLPFDLSYSYTSATPVATFIGHLQQPSLDSSFFPFFKLYKRKPSQRICKTLPISAFLGLSWYQSGSYPYSLQVKLHVLHVPSKSQNNSNNLTCCRDYCFQIEQHPIWKNPSQPYFLS